MRDLPMLMADTQSARRPLRGWASHSPRKQGQEKPGLKPDPRIEVPVLRDRPFLGQARIQSSYLGSIHAQIGGIEVF